MEKTKLSTVKLVKCIVSHIADSESDDWPPKCATFLYQPKRPQFVKIEADKEMTNLHNSPDHV